LELSEIRFRYACETRRRDVRAVLLFLLGIPIPVIILIALLT
jgi:hypothetical protein